MGCPKGSILGPLLFLLYINDLGSVSSLLSPIMFADDSNVFSSAKNPQTIVNSVNIELNKIVGWLQANRLSLNIKKTHYMLFSQNKKFKTTDLNLKIEGNKIERVHSTKFLGVMIDDQMTWKAHINHLTSKLSKSIGILARARKVFDRKILNQLYNSILQPHFFYCAIVWGNADKSTLDPLFKLQKKAIRIICNLRWRDSTSSYFKSLNILKLEDTFRYLVGVFMFQFNENNLPNVFTNYFTKNRSGNRYRTRYTNMYRMPLYHTKLGSLGLRKQGVIIGNDLYLVINKCKSLNIFKNTIKKAMMNTY